MTSTGYQPPGTWQWPEDLNLPPPPSSPPSDPPTPTSTSDRQSEQRDDIQEERRGGPQEEQHDPSQQDYHDPSQQQNQDPSQPEHHDHPQQNHRFYPPRTCRICLETVLPTYHTPSEHLPGMFQSSPSVTYQSEDGRLIRPCLCKGSQKYVHEGCLNAWRLRDPTQKRNYWQCPTCRYQYRLERMTWARWISSTASQLFLTLMIFFLATFLLGFVADPILNLYIDPLNTLADIPTHGTEALYDDDSESWIEHFLKGMASLGLLGFAKVILTLSPWQMWNVRSSGVIGGGGNRGNTGRDRISQIGWLAIVFGITTVLVAVWRGVRAWSRKTLEQFSDRVLDVPGSEDDADDDE